MRSMTADSSKVPWLKESKAERRVEIVDWMLSIASSWSAMVKVIGVSFNPSISPFVSAIFSCNSSKPIMLSGSKESAIRLSSSESEAKSSREIPLNFSSNRSLVLSYLPPIFWIFVTMSLEVLYS